MKISHSNIFFQIMVLSKRYHQNSQAIMGILSSGSRILMKIIE